MREDHLPEVLEIERTSFKVPWSKAAFLTELRRPETSEWRVAEEEGRVIGYGGLLCVGREGHITNLAVAGVSRRKGVARMILDELTNMAKQRGIASLTLEVRESNEAAIALYEKSGFHVVGRRKRYYPEDNEDALIMWKYEL
ncbi:MAG: ribosomal-protein-alanine N-acetyltransferase [Actinobacteria bacterium]|nr:MAG: ribosomal-protein-alanine N-acetyltransferase [Actinomycetota bacterium]